MSLGICGSQEFDTSRVRLRLSRNDSNTRHALDSGYKYQAKVRVREIMTRLQAAGHPL